MDKNKWKNYLIVALIAIMVLFGILGGKRVQRYRDEVNGLKMAKTTLTLQNESLNKQVRMKNDTIKKKDFKILELMALFKAKDKQITEIIGERDVALAKLNGITADSSYQFLINVAYNYPSVLKFLFNEIQVKYIHSDYITARSSEKIIPAMTAQLNNAKEQFIVRDNIESELKNVNELQNQTLANCEKINQDNDKIIKDTEKQRDKERHRKNLWRFTSAVAGSVAVILSAFVL